MVYDIIVSPRAIKEIENIIDYYSLYSQNVPNNFITILKETFETLKLNPFYKVRYKNIRTFKMKKFPITIYFVVVEEQNKIKILSCFHNKRSPNKSPSI